MEVYSNFFHNLCNKQSPQISETDLACDYQFGLTDRVCATASLASYIAFLTKRNKSCNLSPENIIKTGNRSVKGMDITVILLFYLSYTPDNLNV